MKKRDEIDDVSGQLFVWGGALRVVERAQSGDTLPLQSVPEKPWRCICHLWRGAMQRLAAAGGRATGAGVCLI